MEQSWKPVHIVLRPNVLSIYKDKDCTRLRHHISLSDLTAVARQRDPKRKAKHVFALFSPERNFHIEAGNERDAQEWVELIRREARIDEEEEEEENSRMILSPIATNTQNFNSNGSRTNMGATCGASTSGSEGDLPVRHSRTNLASAAETMHSARKPTRDFQSYSGNEHGSYSDFSDTGFLGSNLSLSHPDNTQKIASRNAAADAIYSPSSTTTTTIAAAAATENQRPSIPRNPSQLSTSAATGEERVVYHGWLHLLKSKGGVRQWKTLWAVLRPKSLALYKNEEEYSALLIMPFPSIVDVVDIDPMSRTKRHCMQAITEERNYRFCALSEEELVKWLGAFKSLLSRRREGDVLRERERREMENAGGVGGGNNINNLAAGTGKRKENVVSFSEEGIGTTSTSEIRSVGHK